ncbi:MAG: tetratricopeptide repeat protein, partial [Cyclobacteriaceae bacterium]
MWVTAQSLHAQDQTEIALANNYLQSGQNEKALALFQELVKQPANIPLIHTPYLELLLEIGKYKQAEEYIDRLNKRENNIAYRLDIGYVYYRSGDAARADKYWRQIIQQNIGDTYRARQMVDYFTAHALVDYGVDVYQQLRQKMNNPRMFVLELANLYRLQGKREEMVNEYLNYVTQTPSNLNYIKNLLQILLTKPEEYEALQRVLIERSQ